MAPLTSQLFAGDQLLQDIADDVNQVRISQSANSQGPSVGRVQHALLLWNPGVLPLHGVDEDYGGETATAVHLFKVQELHVSEPQVIDDVGPRTQPSIEDEPSQFWDGSSFGWGPKRDATAEVRAALQEADARTFRFCLHDVTASRDPNGGMTVVVPRRLYRESDYCRGLIRDIALSLPNPPVDVLLADSDAAAETPRASSSASPERRT